MNSQFRCASILLMARIQLRRLRPVPRTWWRVMVFCLIAASTRAADLSLIQINASDFVRYSLSNPAFAEKIRASGNLKPGADSGIGWVEYEFQVRSEGFYELGFVGWGDSVELMVDPTDDSWSRSGTYFFGLAQVGPQRQKVGNVWLTVGRHRLRVQRLHWTGLPPITAFELRPADGRIEGSLAVDPIPESRVFRMGECGSLNVVANIAAGTRPFEIFVLDARTKEVLATHDLAFPKVAGRSELSFPVPCSVEGAHVLAFGSGGRPVPALGTFQYEVLDATPIGPADRPAAPASDGLLYEIDCAQQKPDYSGVETRIVSQRFGRYREAPGSGWTNYQQARSKSTPVPSQPAWFAYTLDRLVPQQPYRIEIDYPDDRRRTFAIALRESAPLAYPVTIGITSGGEYSTSHSMATQAMTVWPRGKAPRLLFVTAHDGEAAACGRIRVREAGAPKPPLVETVAGRRRIVHWYEEGINFQSLFSPPASDPRADDLTATRWMETAREFGVNFLIPTAAVYGGALYPSRREITDIQPQRDDLRRLLIKAEKYQIRVAPEIHPRADQLGWGFGTTGDVPDNLLVSREGKTNFYSSDGRTRNLPPHFDLLDSRVQSWYVDLVGEIADRYRDSPALDGISLRYMQWSNGAFNNMVSLEWGYGDRTIALFSRETGVSVPVGKQGDPDRFAQRFQWLTTTARDPWIKWRCRKVAQLVSKVRDRVRAARPDLKLYLHVFDTDVNAPDLPSNTRGEGVRLVRMRAAGIDPDLLRAIEGVILIDSSYAYGRHKPDNAFLGNHDHLLDPVSLSALRGKSAGRFIFGMQYVEANEKVVPPERLGFDAATKATWMSTPANPAGRHALERFAVPLADADALMLGDGGNAYTFGPPVVKEFLREFAQLPDRPFVELKSVADPVMIRILQGEDGMQFYAVNRERYAVTTTIRSDRPANWTRQSSGELLSGNSATLKLDLKPYELLVGRVGPGAAIVSATSEVPATAKSLVTNRITWIKRFAETRQAIAGLDRTVLDWSIGTAETALAAGHLWRARTVLENNCLLNLFRRFDCFPPGLSVDAASEKRCDLDPPLPPAQLKMGLKR